MRLIGLAGALTLSACSPQCGNEVLEQAISPDKEHIATAFERDCGATTDYARIVVVGDASKRFDGDDVDQFIFTMKGQHHISLRWETDDTLLIVRPDMPQNIFKQLTSWNGVNIKYVTR